MVSDDSSKKGGGEPPDLEVLRSRVGELESENKDLEAFNYTVAHDLYMPLMRIEGYSEVLLKEHAAGLDEAGEDCIHRVNKAAREAKQTLNDLLALSRATHCELECVEIDMSKMAEKVTAIFVQSDQGRSVDIKIKPNMYVWADKALLRILLLNLIGNAWKYTRKKIAPYIEISESTKKGDTIYAIKDNGAGFDQKQVSELFDAFNRGGRVSDYEGNGIGLATVKRIIERHGGTVWAEGSPGNGAVFYFTLPRG